MAGVRQLFEMFHSAFAEAGVEVDDNYFRVEGGLLAEHWGVMDAAGMMQQLTAH